MIKTKFEQFFKMGLQVNKHFLLILMVVSFWVLSPYSEVKSEPSSTMKNSIPSIEMSEWLLPGDGFAGTFFQPLNSNRSWSKEFWREEFSKMTQIGMKTLILQWSEYDEFNFFEDTDQGPSIVKTIAGIADEMGIDFYVGLSIRKSWWELSKISSILVEEELVRNMKLADQMYPTLKRFKSFRGWYIPHEVTDLHYKEYQRELIYELFSKLSHHLRRLAPLKPIFGSGYTRPGETSLVRFVSRWSEFLDNAGIDYFIFQDGAGIADMKNWKDVVPYLDAIVQLDEDFPGDVWLLMEIFSQTDGPPLNKNPFKAEPAQPFRVLEELKVLETYKRNIIIYNYFDYMRPSAGEKQAELYGAYQRDMSEKISKMLKNGP
jgi:hypothetical protein